MLIFTGEQLNNFLSELKKDFDFFDARIGGSPFKKYFFPAVEEIFSLEKEREIESPKSPAKFVLFGLGLQDLEALTQLDEIMSKPNEDYFYWQRRKQSVVIGIIREAVDVSPGGDIVFQEIDGGQYRVFENTVKGKSLIKKYKEIFSVQDKNISKKEIIAPQIPEGESLGEWGESMRQLLLDPEILANAVEWSRNHKIWDELAEICLGCGICTYVCPLCYCFSVEDRVGLDDKCTRCRKWTACTLPEFSRIAGGHSFRPILKERYYNWFYHKFVRAYNEYGKSQCVGCGRCKRECPAKIDIKEILETILNDYKKQNG